MQITPPLWEKAKGTKEPLDESERREWKSWLKTQHSKSQDHGIWFHIRGLLCFHMNCGFFAVVVVVLVL